MDDLIKDLEAKLLDKFQALAKDLSERFPNLHVNVTSHEVGSLSELKGHTLAISVVFNDAPLSQSDNVALCVDLCHLTTMPKINADVCWGHPSGFTEGEFYSEWETNSQWPEASAATLEQLFADLPRLYKVLEDAVQRRVPSDTANDN